MPQATLDKLRFFTDTPDLSAFQFPEAPPDVGQSVEETPPTSRVVVAKTGTFRHPRYGEFKVSAKTFDTMIANFGAGIPTPELPVDFDHEPDVGGKSEACGWVKSLSHDGTYLYAQVEWLWRGAFAIREKTYQYVSPTWSLAYVDESGAKRGPTLLAFGLTNRPYFTLPAVSLSASFSREEFSVCEEVEEPSDSRPRMSEFATFAKALGLSEDADEQAIVTAATETYARSEQSLEDRAKAEGKVIFTQAEADKLKADKDAATSDAEKAEDRIKALEEKDADRAFSTLYNRALENPAGPLVAPAEEKALRTIFNAEGEDGFAEYLKARTPIVNGRARGNRGENAELSEADKREFALEGADVDEEALQIYRKAEVKAREEKRDVAEVYIELAEAEGVTA